MEAQALPRLHQRLILRRPHGHRRSCSRERLQTLQMKIQMRV
jgi:hypothetical protein